MWISNTATTAMMVPIMEAILEELYSSEDKAAKEFDGDDDQLRNGAPHLKMEGERDLAEEARTKEMQAAKEKEFKYVKYVKRV